jgi:hypothetical protein
MKRCLSYSLFVIACSVVLAAPAQAGNAHFGGKCSVNSGGTQMTCFFDALRGDSLGNPGSSCNSGTPQYYWEFGDFTDSGSFSYNNLVGHTYPLPIVSGTRGYPYGYYVDLFVQCPEGLFQGTRYICVYGFGFAGCISSTSNTWN